MAKWIFLSLDDQFCPLTWDGIINALIIINHKNALQIIAMVLLVHNYLGSLPLLRLSCHYSK